MKYSLTALTFAAAASALPTAKTFRADEMCGQWETATAGPYTVYNNLWGQDSATSGQQCTTIDNIQDGDLSWHTAWTWMGGEYEVKSYANVVPTIEPKKLSALSSIPASWDWEYEGSNLVCNVAFDAFLSSTAEGDAEYEIMVWIGALGGAGPISESGKTIATPDLAGSTWDLYKGKNNQMTVFSFVTQENQKSFSGDLFEFVTYLQNNQNLGANQFLQSLGGGTEPFVGNNAVLKSTSFSLSIS